MAKEALQSPYSNLLMREVFRDEQALRANGGTPTGVVFSEGRGLFSSASASRKNYI